MYHIFGELLDISDTVIVFEKEIEEAIKLVTGDSILNPDMVLHHAGYYYLQAANSMQRKRATIAWRESGVSTSL